jgi:hypothetical protein
MVLSGSCNVEKELSELLLVSLEQSAVTRGLPSVHPRILPSAIGSLLILEDAGLQILVLLFRCRELMPVAVLPALC